MANFICFTGHAGGGEDKFVVRIDELSAVNLSKATGARASAAITLIGSSGGVQLCSFANRNRTFRSLQRHLGVRLPRLLALWSTASTERLRRLGVPQDEICLREIPCRIANERGT